MRLKDKVVLVTASTRGIGLAIVKACAGAGATVFMADRELELAEQEARKLNEAGGKVFFGFHDAQQAESYPAVMEQILSVCGRVDVLVNNFGASKPEKDLDFTHTDPNVFLETVTANLQSVFLMGQAAARIMAGQGGGSIINISSVGGSVPDVSQISYGTSKAAINYLTKLIAVQEAERNIRCNAVLPGMTATESVEKNLSREFRELFLRHIPLRRMGLPEEIAQAVLYFASDESAYTTGQILTVSGGFGLATPVYSELSGRGRKR